MTEGRDQQDEMVRTDLKADSAISIPVVAFADSRGLSIGNQSRVCTYGLHLTIAFQSKEIN